jgi:hypothetical protein
MADKPKTVLFKTEVVTVYRPGSGHPFSPGELMLLPEDHVAAVQAHDERAKVKLKDEAAAEETRAKAAALKPVAEPKTETATPKPN